MHLEEHARSARKFLQEAKKSSNKADTRVKINRAWLSGAELQDVLNFLSQWTILFMLQQASFSKFLDLVKCTIRNCHNWRLPNNHAWRWGGKSCFHTNHNFYKLYHSLNKILPINLYIYILFIFPCQPQLEYFLRNLYNYIRYKTYFLYIYRHK